MRILVFDLNLVFANQVAKLLENHLRDVTIDFANNQILLSHYLRENCYDLILADIDTAADSESAVELLHSMGTLVVLWSVLDRRLKFRDTGSNVQMVRKPVELKEVLQLIESATKKVDSSRLMPAV